MTGFDVPSCSTIYLDKPMRNHTLMQTIARANRVFGDKVNGLIVDYIGVFRDLQKALAIYGSASGGGIGAGEMPVQAKAALVEELRRAIAEIRAFCRDQRVNLDTVAAADGFQRVALLTDATDTLVAKDEPKRKFLALAANVTSLYRAILPDRAAGEFVELTHLIRILAEKIRSLEEEADITGIVGQVEALLDESIAPPSYVIRGSAGQIEGAARELDLSRIDFEALRRQFESSRKHIEAEKLRAAINHKLNKMVRLNRTRMDYYEKFQQMIADYNAGASNVDAFYAQLISFARALNAEARRAASAHLTEEELALLDLLTKPDIKLTKTEEDQVRAISQDLLATLKRTKLGTGLAQEATSARRCSRLHRTRT